MEKDKKIKKSIQDRTSRVAALLTEGALLIVAIVMLVMIFNLRETFIQSSNNAGKDAESISSDTVIDQVKDNLLQSAESKADAASEALEKFQSSVKVVADGVGRMYDNPSEYSARKVDLPDAKKDGKLSMQLLFSAKTDQKSAAIKKELDLIGNIQDTLLAINKNDPNMVSNYVATESGIMLQADYISGKKFDKKGKILPYEAAERPWYQGAMKTKAPFFTSLSRDAHTSGIGIMCGVPIYKDKKIVGVSGAGMYLDELEKAVLSTKVGKDGYACMIDDGGQVIFSSGSSETFSDELEKVSDLRKNSQEEVANLVKKAVKGETGVTHFSVDGIPSYVAYAPVDVVGWTFLTIIPEYEVLQPTEHLVSTLSKSTEYTIKSSNNQIRGMIIVLVIIFIILYIITFIISKKAAAMLVRQLKTLTQKVQSLEGNDLDFEWNDDTEDEIQVLAESFSSMTARMKQYISDITTITAEKERIGAELELATKIQADMLPNIFPPFPERKDIDIFASMTPAKEVGGDFYDFFLIDDDHLGLVMADVSGKGVPAALFMMMSKILVKNYATMAGPEASPATVLEQVNDTICSNNEEEMFVTVWLGIMKISTGHVIAANAGHEYPIIKKADGGFELLKDKHGFVIGGMEGVRYKDYEFDVEKGGALVVYTDGVAEATNASDELFGTDRTLESLNKVQDGDSNQLLTHLKSDVDEFVGEAPQFDDLTMLAVRR
ncbi:SpoIIE family protein phosphatase [Eubacterium xylanophilum]|uniref:SpoIIE family protein phosphatase n=1 Tax=Eubacterium xylanophilum TaxID=39497 RepID=UPI0004AD67D9|nr:SpoIIE family protein phosphatase [Eubacterium xylanophilum]